MANARALILAQGSREQELSEEIDSYLEMLVQDKINAGMDPEQARRRARVEMGGVEQGKRKTAVTSARRGGWKTCCRIFASPCGMLRKNPAFTVVVVLTLALGIGANTAMFTVVQSVLLKPLAYPEESRLVQLFQTFGKNPALYESFSAANFKDYRTQATAFERLACLDRFTEVNFNLTGSSRPRRIVATPVSAGFFELLGFSAYPGTDIHRGGGARQCRDRCFESQVLAGAI